MEEANTISNAEIIKYGFMEEYELEKAINYMELTKHPTIDGVMVGEIDCNIVPAEIRDLILDRKMEVVSAGFIIFEGTSIPLHSHITDSEIYYNGENITVELYDNKNNSLKKSELQKGEYTLTEHGENHKVTQIDSTKKSLLFFVKFKTKQNLLEAEITKECRRLIDALR